MADQFIGLFLLHVLPAGLHRIRYYGLLANPHRQEKLEQCRQLLQLSQVEEESSLAVKMFQSKHGIHYPIADNFRKASRHDR